MMKFKKPIKKWTLEEAKAYCAQHYDNCVTEKCPLSNKACFADDIAPIDWRLDEKAEKND